VSSVLKSIFGGKDTSAQSAQIDANRRAEQFIKQSGQQARSDALGLFPGADINRNLGFQSALDVFGQTIPGQIDAFQQGNFGAQQQLLAGLPLQNNAILGLPTDLSTLQPQRINVDTGFAQQQLPQFITTPELLQQPGLVQPQGPLAGPGGIDFSRFLSGLGGS